MLKVTHCVMLNVKVKVFVKARVCKDAIPTASSFVRKRLACPRLVVVEDQCVEAYSLMLETPIENINLPRGHARICHILHEHGIDTVKDLLSLSENDLRKFSGLGKKSIRALDNALSKINKHLEVQEEDYKFRVLGATDFAKLKKEDREKFLVAAPLRMAEMVRLYVDKKQTLTQIAAKYQISISRVSQVLHQAFRRYRNWQSRKKS